MHKHNHSPGSIGVHGNRGYQGAMDPSEFLKGVLAPTLFIRQLATSQANTCTNHNSDHNKLL